MRTSFFSWLFVCSILLIRVDANAVFGQCLDSQQSLLLQLKNSLDFDRYWSTKIVTWNQSTECCSWNGASCDEDFNVVRLDLSNDGISGKLDNASGLFALKHLKSLDLSNNYYGFSIQNLTVIVQNFSELEELYLDGLNLSTSGNEWGQALSSLLPNLRVLSLSNCHLSGPLDQSLMKLQSLSVILLEANNLSSPVPRSIAKLSNLTSLNLRSSGLQGTFPREIFQVPTLQILDISENGLLQGTLPEFPKNSSLFHVDLSDTKFSGRLPNSIGNLWNLSTLFLSNCQFTGTLHGSMAKLTRLLYVDLSHNNFTGSIPSFNFSKNLTRIHLSNNSLTGEILSTQWEFLANLENIYMSSNFFTGTIPLPVFVLQSLQTIQLSNNQFSGCVPEFTTSSSTLNILDLSHNNLEGPFPISFFKLENLTYFDLSYNKFNGTIELNLFQGFTRLVHLDLSYNNWSVHTNGSDNSLRNIRELGLSSCNLEAVPNLKMLSALQILDLSNNRIPGVIPKWIWEIGDMKLAFLNMSHNSLVGFEEPFNFSISLNVLDLHFNKLHGKMPTLPQDFKYVDFSGNKFTSIPIDIFQGFHFLGFFSLSNNSLSGLIPESVCNTSSLGVLDFSYNTLNGKIPKCIIALGNSLVVLNLRNNNFSGVIPDAFPSGCGLKTLDLNGNSLEGKIPKSLANCSTLDVLDLGNNQIGGTLPSFLINISTMQVLILRSDKFYAGIECPKSKGTWPMIQIFDLAHNELGGEISGHWLTKLQGIMANEANTALKILGFSHRYSISYSKSSTDKEIYYRYTVTVSSKGQEMELPKILTIFTCIDLSSNNFHGSIPDELGQLQALIILNLSNNAFTGDIPLSIGSLRKLESLDLSWNKLNGMIPASLGQLNFLQFMNLSFNQLTGRIPKGSQIQTFSEDSFIGNEGLCGLPLSTNCSDEAAGGTSLLNAEKGEDSNSEKISWNLLSVEIEFIVGFGIVVQPLVFVKSWRKRYFERVDDIVIRILPSTVARKWFLWTTT